MVLPFGLVSNTVVAPLILGETVTKPHILSTVLIIFGSVWIVCFSIHPKDTDLELGMEKLGFLATRPLFLSFVVFSGLVLAVVLSRVYVRRSNLENSQEYEPLGEGTTNEGSES